MAAPFGGRAPAMTVLGPPRYTSRRATAGRYDAMTAAFDAIITFHPTEPSWRESSSITCKAVASSTSAPPTAVGTDILKTPASRRASKRGRGTWRACSPASRHCATTGARARARSTHSFVLMAVCVVMDAAPFCLYTPQPGRVSRQVTPLSSLFMTHTRAQCKKNFLDCTIRVLYSPRQHEWHAWPQRILVSAALAVSRLRHLCCSHARHATRPALLRSPAAQR